MIGTGLLEASALILILLCVAWGIHKGFLMQIFSLLRIAVILVVTIVLVPLILPMIDEENIARSGIAYVAAMVFAVVVIWLIRCLLKMIQRLPVIRQANKIGGALVGFCIGVVLVWIALTVIGAFQEAEWCREISSCAKESEILRTIQQFDPMTYIWESYDFPLLF